MYKMVQSGIGFVVFLIAMAFCLDVPTSLMNAPSNVSFASGVLILALMAWGTFLVAYQLVYKNIIQQLEEK